MKTTVFLDNDGVLVDTERHYARANMETCERHGYTLTRAEYQRLFLSSSAGLREVAACLNWSGDKLAAVRAERDTLYESLLRTEEIDLGGIGEGLERLSRSATLCVVTSSPRRYFDIIHERTGFLPFFSAIVSEEDVTRYKPDPEPYLLALARTNVEPGQGIVLEDSARGLQSALGAGLECVVIPRELTKDQDFGGATAVVGTFSDAVTLIEGMTKKGR